MFELRGGVAILSHEQILYCYYTLVMLFVITLCLLAVLMLSSTLTIPALLALITVYCSQCEMTMSDHSFVNCWLHGLCIPKCLMPSIEYTVIAICYYDNVMMMNQCCLASMWSWLWL